MSIAYKPMRPGQEDAVATLIRQLPRDLGLDVQPLITGEVIRQWKNDVHVIVAEDSGLICGVCLWFLHYSTWRALKGCYICDLYVMEHLRGKKIGQGLLQAAARAAHRLGAGYLRLDVTRLNEAPKAFYSKLGFVADEEDLAMFLEPQNFKTYVGEEKS
ncbi:MAG: GNAT family N-acetyltransferase [Aestuariivirga sp.]|jgi:GNAT superfamily N-acetyltransferase